MSKTSSVDIFGDFTRLSQNQDVSKSAYYLTDWQMATIAPQGYLNTFGTAVGSLLKSFSYLCRQKGLTDNYYEATTGIIGRFERLRPLLPGGTSRNWPRSWTSPGWARWCSISPIRRGRGSRPGTSWCRYSCSWLVWRYPSPSLVIRSRGQAYVVSHVISFRSISKSLFFGLEQYVGDYYGFLIQLSNCTILFIVLYLLYKNRIFLRV